MTVTYQSAAAVIADGIKSAVRSDAALMAMLNADGIYQGRVPPSKVAPYLVLQTPTETEQPLFGRSGSSNAEQVHIWTESAHEIRVIYVELARVLGDGFAVAGFELSDVNVSFLGSNPDPDDDVLWHGIARVTARLLKVLP